MTIINPNSISGITSFTAEADVMNFYRSNGTLGSLQLNGVNFNTTNGISTFNNLNVGGVLTYEDVKNVDSVGIISARTAIHVGAGISAVGIITGTSFRGDGSQLTGITQVGGATTVGFDDNKSIYFGSQDDYRMGWSGTTMTFEPTSSSTTQILHLTSNNQMYIKSKASGLFLMSGNQNVIDIYGGYGGGIYFKNNNTQYLKLEYGNWTFLNNTEVRIPDKLVHAGDENTSIRFPAADTVSVETGGSERLRVDSSGRLLLGATASRDNDVNFQIEGLGYQSSTMQITRNSANADGGGIYIVKTRGSADDASTIVQSGDELGYINFRGADGTDGNTNAATIQAFCDGTPGSNDMPGRLVFNTTPDGASSSTERLRITSEGNVHLNYGNPVSSSLIILDKDGGGEAQIRFYNASSNTAQIALDSGENLTFDVGGAERLHVTSGGQVGINSSDPDVDLVVSHAGQNTGMGVTVYINSQKNNASLAGSAELRLGFHHTGNNDGKADAYIKLEEDGGNSFDGNLTIGVPVNNNGGGSTTWDSVKFEGGQTGVDVSLSGTASGIASVTWDASANSLIFKDDSEAKFGDGGDLRLYHDSGNSHIKNSTGTLRIRGDSIKINNAAANKNAIVCESDVVTLYYDNSAKLATTNDGVVITGITTFTKGCNFKGILKERHKQTDAKLSADVNIDLELGNVHYYSVNETTTATPNIRYNSSYSLNSKMNIGETVSVTIIYKPNNAGYYASLNVDGSGVTEEWNGGSAPDSANSGGYDILTHTLLKVADASYLCFSNVQNYA